MNELIIETNHRPFLQRQPALDFTSARHLVFFKISIETKSLFKFIELRFYGSYQDEVRLRI